MANGYLGDKLPYNNPIIENAFQEAKQNALWLKNQDKKDAILKNFGVTTSNLEHEEFLLGKVLVTFYNGDASIKILSSAFSSEYIKLKELEKEKLEKEIREKQIREENNLCQHCGGPFKGLFKKVCSNCGKPKDY